MGGIFLSRPILSYHGGKNNVKRGVMDKSTKRNILNLSQKIKQSAEGWREKDYEGVSPTTRRFLKFWFKLVNKFVE